MSSYLAIVVYHAPCVFKHQNNVINYNEPQSNAQTMFTYKQKTKNKTTMIATKMEKYRRILNFNNFFFKKSKMSNSIFLVSNVFMNMLHFPVKIKQSSKQPFFSHKTAHKNQEINKKV